VIYELGMIRNEAVVAYFKVLSENCTYRIEENHKLHSGWPVSGPRSNA
jgi:hypothetical protein